MSDALSSHDLPGMAGDDELIFDEALPVDIAVSAPPAAEAAEPRRAPRRGRKSKEEGATPEPAAATPMPIPSAAAASAAAEEPAGAPAPFPPQGANPAGSKSQPLLLAVVGFALLTSTLSLGGMIAVGRTLAHAGADRQEAAAERAALAGIPTLVAHLDAASARLDAAASRTAPAAPAMPVTAPAGTALSAADLHREIDGLKLALGQRQPEGLGALEGTTREGLSDLTTKVDRLADEIAQLERRGGSADAAVSANRPASRAGGPRRPS